MCDDVCKAYVTRILAWLVAFSGRCVPKGMEKQDVEARVVLSPSSLHPEDAYSMRTNQKCSFR